MSRRGPVPVALASNYGREPIDPPADGWLGHDTPSEKIRGSGLWNVAHVDESYDPEFIDRLAGAVEGTEPP